MATPLEQLDAMRGLAPNWDGYNADPPAGHVLDVAKEFVALLTTIRPDAAARGVYVTPGRAGGVLVEWSDPTAEHELEIEADGTWGFLHTDRATGAMTERRFKPTANMIHPGVLQELRRLAA
jgi:hypothetical protein